jgi:hypothetical protein
MRMLDEPKTIVYNFPILVLDIWQKTTGLSSSKCFLCATLEKGTELFECRQDQRTKIKPCLGAFRMLQVKSRWVARVPGMAVFQITIPGHFHPGRLEIQNQIFYEFTKILILLKI